MTNATFFNKISARTFYRQVFRWISTGVSRRWVNSIPSPCWISSIKSRTPEPARASVRWEMVVSRILGRAA